MMIIDLQHTVYFKNNNPIINPNKEKGNNEAVRTLNENYFG